MVLSRCRVLDRVGEGGDEAVRRLPLKPPSSEGCAASVERVGPGRPIAYSRSGEAGVRSTSKAFPRRSRESPAFKRGSVNLPSLYHQNWSPGSMRRYSLANAQMARTRRIRQPITHTRWRLGQYIVNARNTSGGGDRS